jgi:AcrR family transcriptional regulator
MGRALRVLMADGTPYRDLTVERLVTEAGVARSTFYAHFNDKAGLLRALSHRTLSRLYATGPQEWFLRGPDADRDEIVSGMRHLLEIYLEDEAAMRAVIEASVYDTSVRDAYLGGVERYVQALARMIRSGREQGWVRDVDPVETAETLAWMMERTVSRLAPGSSPARLDAIARAMADVFSRTLFP